MKYLFLIGLLSVFVCTAIAQELPLKQKADKKPLLFQHVPNKTGINPSEFLKTLHLKKSDDVTISISPEITFTGKVIERVEQKDLISVNILLTNYDNALLNLSITTQPDHSKKIAGRIIHPQRGDALIISEEDGKYYLTKQPAQYFMVE